MTENLTIAWLKEPEAKDYPAALSYLSLLYDEAVAQSRDRPAASGSLGVQGEGRAQGLRSPTSGRQQSTRGEGPEENPRGTGAVSAPPAARLTERPRDRGGWVSPAVRGLPSRRGCGDSLSHRVRAHNAAGRGALQRLVQERTLDKLGREDSNLQLPD